MRAQNAAAEAGTSAHGYSKAGDVVSIPLPWAALPSVIAQRLRAAGITTCEQWRALGVKRRMSEQIDAAVAALLKRGSANLPAQSRR
jgi:hypothetical protein